MLSKIREAAHFISNKISSTPRIGLITGTGLGNLTQRMEMENRIPYMDIPYFPSSTITGHKGILVTGNIGGKRVIAMEGRFHIYEGYSPGEVVFPVRVMRQLGINILLISSAAGGLNPNFEAGDLMVLTDHINLTGHNPLVGPNLDRLGPRFPDMSEVYDRRSIKLVQDEAMALGISLRQGVYVGVLGPSLETRAETRFLRMIGADAVGMSTVPETIVGVHCGLKIIAIVVITNMNLPDCMQRTSIDEVILTAEKAGQKLALLWESVIKALPD